MEHNYPSYHYGKWLSNPPPDEEIVVSGIAGKFPKSNNVNEFYDNLFNKNDMISENRWKIEHPEIPPRSGILPNIEEFDPGFFGLHYRQILTMSPSLRKMMEVATEAIIDAGIHPSELAGTKTGVFAGYCWNDGETDVLTRVSNRAQMFGITGLLRTVIPNRISYFFKLKGPSYITDTACSSSSAALDHALRAIRNGECDKALVTTCHYLLAPAVTVQFFRLGVLSVNSRCKVFDEDANGYVRSEAVSCLFLQKSKDARRIYVRVVHCKSNSDGFNPEGITYPSTLIQGQLLNEVYSECGIKPSELSYIEAHGTATKVGDVEEVKAIDNNLAKNRTEPLYIGSVKSSIGHSEPGSGLSSIIKIILGMHSGYLLPNINLNKVKKDLTGIIEGRMKVVTDVVPLKDEKAIAGVNSFGFGGSNTHVVLQRYGYDQKINDGISRLVCVSGRCENSVLVLLEELKGRDFDIDLVALFHQIFKKEFLEHPYRGFLVWGPNGPGIEQVKFCPLVTVPFYVTFGNFEQSYKLVGSYFLRFPVFQNTVSKIEDLLKISVSEILKGSKKEVEDNTLLASIVQLAIIDVLKILEVNPKLVFETSTTRLLSQYYNNSASLKEILKQLQVRSNQSLNGFNGTTPDVRPVKSVVLEISDLGVIGKNPEHFLEILGRLYLNNYNPQLHKLYPEVKFPVRRSTPTISPMIKWNHVTKWYVPGCKMVSHGMKTSNQFSLEEETDRYIEGHVIDGRNLFPATGYLYAVWESYASNYLNRSAQVAPVVFENCKFIRATIMPKTGYLRMKVSIQRHTGYFEVIENNAVVVTGRIISPKNIRDHQCKLEVKEENLDGGLDQQDIYKELHLRGYDYSGLFKNMVKCNVDATSGLLRWDGNWVAFMDTMLQMRILQKDTRDLFVPVEIKKLVVDPIEHLKIVENIQSQEKILPVQAFTEVIKSGGIEISGLLASAISKRKQALEPVLEKHVFVPNQGTLPLPEILRVNTQIILEDTMQEKFRAVEVIDDMTPSQNSYLAPLIFNTLEDVPVVQPDLTISTKTKTEDIPGIKIENYALAPESNLLLVVGTKIMQRPTYLKTVLTALNKTGYILTREPSGFSPEDSSSLTVITEFSCNSEKIVLYRRTQNVENRKYIKVSSENFDWIQDLKKALEAKPWIVLYSQGHSSEGLLGFVNCIRREPGGNRISCVFIMDKMANFEPQNLFFSEQIKKNLAVNICKDGKWGTYRHLRLEDSTDYLCEHSFVTCLSRGDLSTLKWIEGPISLKQQHEDTVIISYSAINFKDIMTATGRIMVDVGRLRQEIVEGLEYSGWDSRNRRTMGFVSNGALSTLILAQPYFNWLVPDDWSLEDAATVPCVYGTVIYGLVMRTKLRHGDSILIHSATGGIGLATINVALYHGCEIFVTVGTQEKRNYIKKHFPQIPESHIGNSRDLSFREMIFKETNGRGVDIVLNSLAEEKLLASVQCLAQGGRFMEIGKFDAINNKKLELLLLKKNASFHGVMLDNVTTEIKKVLWKKVDEGLKAGYIKPLPRTVFESDKAEPAFRYMMTGTHIGKVLLKIRDEKDTSKPLMKGRPRFYCDSNKCYVVIGGLGGFGLELVDWLVLRGARKLFLTSRSGITTGYQIQRIKIWESYGATVKISQTTISSKQDCITLIKEAVKFAPLDGIFNLAVILKDELFENQTVENFETSLTPKAFATRYLDEVTRELCPDLSYFVVFSSVSCGRGNVGQTNYGMANSIMERICEKRKAEGFPALAIQWGAIGDVGLVAKMQKDNKELVIGGTLQQKISSCLSVLDRFMKQENPVVSSMVVAEKRDKNLGSGSVVDVVATVIGIKDLKTISHHSTLAELGMDSMMGTEVMQILEKDFEIFISAKEIRNLTFEKLKEMGDSKPEAQDQNKQKISEGTQILIKYIPEYSMEPIIKLQSVQTKDSPTIFVLPGIEGVLKLLAPLTTKLKANLWGLEYSYKNPEDTIQDMVKRLLPLIEQKLTGKTFNFLAYSFGSTIALELASLLEQKGYTGTILAVDGSPYYTKQVTNHFVPEGSEAENETMVLSTIFATLLPLEELQKHKNDLVKCPSFDERFKLIISLIPKDVVDVQKLDKQAAFAVYKRFKAIRNYNIDQKKIKSFVKLYKADVTLVSGLDEDYRMSEMCGGKVEVMSVKGDHHTMLEQKEIADDINAIFKM